MQKDSLITLHKGQITLVKISKMFDGDIQLLRKGDTMSRNMPVSRQSVHMQRLTGDFTVRSHNK